MLGNLIIDNPPRAQDPFCSDPAQSHFLGFQLVRQTPDRSIPPWASKRILASRGNYVDGLAAERYCMRDGGSAVRAFGEYRFDAVGAGRVQLDEAPCESARAARVLAAGKLHADDTPFKVLAPGTGSTEKGRLG